MRFVVYGAGSVGSVLGGYLVLAGYDVVLIGRAPHVNQIMERGLSVQDRDGTHIIIVDAAKAVSEISPRVDDVILLCTKSQNTTEAISALQEWTSAKSPLFCFQNGVTNEVIASQFFERVYGVQVAIGGRYIAPGRVTHYASRAVALGCYPAGLDDQVTTVGAALNAAGCEVTYSPNVMAVKWSKLIINSCNAFYALSGLSIPEAHRDLESREVLADIMEEGVHVLEAVGIEYQSLPGRSTLREEIARLREPEPVQPWPDDPDFDYYPSTWQDLQLERGVTETAFFNGELITLGKQSGVPTPYNQLLMELVEEMAAACEPPGKYTIAELRAMATPACDIPRSTSA